jgi:hypothetical protein
MNLGKFTHRILVFPCAILLSHSAYTQTTLNGMVADSATLKPLPNVNIHIKKTHERTVSNELGFFSIPASDDDTVLFSLVGYYTKAYPVKKIKDAVFVYLVEEQRLLETIVVGDVAIPWLPKLPPEKLWRNTTNNPQTRPIPGDPLIQTFGPGYVLKGPISRFSKYEKNRKKLKTVMIENSKSRGYAELVNAPDVKDKIIKDYALTEEEYYRLLAIFNEKNKDIIYELDSKDLISVLFSFYAENTKKK